MPVNSYTQIRSLYPHLTHEHRGLSNGVEVGPSNRESLGDINTKWLLIVRFAVYNLLSDFNTGAVELLA